MRRHTDKLMRRRTDKENIDTIKSNSEQGIEVENLESSVLNGTDKDSIRILVAIRQSIIRSGLSALLSDQSDFNVVGTAGSCAECYQKALQLSPHLLLCDLETADACPHETSSSNECSLVTQHNSLPDIPTILLQDDRSEREILEASRIGIRGYLTTDAKLEDLFKAIRVVKDGGTFLERRVQSKVLGMLGQLNNGGKLENGDLSAREQTILRLLAQGMRNQEIADTVFLSKSTVKRYLSTMYTKLGASNRAEAVSIGISKNFIHPE